MSDAVLASSEGSVQSNPDQPAGTVSPPSLAKQASSPSASFSSQAPKIDDETKQDIVDVIWKSMISEVESKLLLICILNSRSYGCDGD